MTQEEQKQQVREAIAKWLYTTVVKERRGVKMIPWGELSESIHLAWENEADQILNLKYKSGAPMLAGLEENQDIPTYHYEVSSDYTPEVYYNLAIQDMLRAGWRKTIT